MFQRRGAYRRASVAAALAIAVALTAGSALAQANDTQVDQAKQLLSEERFIEALAAAKDAARADPADYRARYYVAMSYMGLRQYDAAETEAAAAETQAPESAKPAVQKLTQTIRALRKGNSDIAEADTALADGLIGKAARLYEAAWNAGRNAPDHAFKAADLYASRLNQPVDAARVLRQVKQALPASAASDKADAQLVALNPTLRAIATGHVDAARTMALAEALPRLQAAEDADPSFASIYIVRARLAGEAGAVDLVKTSIKDLAKRNLISVERLGAIPNMRGMLAAPEFAQFVADVIGEDQGAALRRMVSPEGQVDLLGKVAQAGNLQLFLGRKSDGEGRFRSFSRRKVTDVRGLDACQSLVVLGDSIETSADVVATLPNRTLDWRLVAPPVLNDTFIGFGPMFDNWEVTGFNVVGDQAQRRQVVAAIQVIREVCPKPAPTKRR